MGERKPRPAETTLLRPLLNEARQLLLLLLGQLRTATRGLFQRHPFDAVAEKLVDVSLDLRDRQLEDDRRLRGVLIMHDGKDRQNEFTQPQITELLCS